MREISNRFKQFRESQHFTQKQLGDVLGVTKDRIGSWDTRTPPPYDVVILLMKNFHLNPNWFFLGEGEMYLSRSDPLVTEQPTMYRQDVAVQAKEAAVVTTGVNNGSIVAEGRRQQYNKDLGERGMRLCAFVQWWMACHDADDQAWLEKQVERAVPEFAAWKQELDKNR